MIGHVIFGGVVAAANIFASKKLETLAAEKPVGSPTRAGLEAQSKINKVAGYAVAVVTGLYVAVELTCKEE